MQFDNNKKFMLVAAVLLIALGLAMIFWDLKIGLLNIVSALIMLYLGVGSLKVYKKNNSKIQLIITAIYFFAFFMNIFSGIFLSWYSMQENNNLGDLEF